MLAAGEAGQVTRGWTEAAHREGGQAQPRPAGRDVRETFISKEEAEILKYMNIYKLLLG